MSKKSRVVFGGLISLLAVVVYASTTVDILPTSDGTYTQWTTSTGSSHFALVDESSCNGTTDYNFTTTVGGRDSYGVSLSAVPNGAQITQISITPCASRNSNGGGSSTMNVFYRLDGVDSSDAGAYSLTGTTPTQLSATSFSGLSKIKTSSTALQSGAIFSSGTKGARLSRIATVITYTTLGAPSNLVATANSSSQIDLAWTDNSTFEDNFVIERKDVTASTTFITIATTTASVVSYSDTGLSASNTYSYRLRAHNVGGYSSYSNTASATTNP